MWLFGFFIGYICVYLPGASYLAARDPEPVGAHAFLLLFGFVMALYASGAYWLTGQWIRRPTRPLAATISGAVCAAALLAETAWVPRGFTFLASLTLSTAALIVVASATSYVSRLRA